MTKVIFVLGTRPEAIKLAPIILAFRGSKSFKTIVLVTGQHRQMLDRVLKLFSIRVDYDLNILKSDQDLYDISSNVLIGCREVYRKAKPDLVLVQGDTTTSFISALAAFYERISIAHVEAGLRTWNKYAPWPEEMNRKMITALADLNFVPTKTSRQNLLDENINKNSIYITGNSGIDALFMIRSILAKKGGIRSKTRKKLDAQLPSGFLRKVDLKKGRLVLLTGHRRENFGQGFKNLCNAIKELAQKFPADLFLYPVHLNPNVRKPVFDLLSNINNVVLCDPLDYPEFIYMMMYSYLIITDSGGVQEEASVFGIPAIITRTVTERPESVLKGTVRLVGTDLKKIIMEVSKLMDNPSTYNKMARKKNLYGNGRASLRILTHVKRYLRKRIK